MLQLAEPTNKPVEIPFSMDAANAKVQKDFDVQLVKEIHWSSLYRPPIVPQKLLKFIAYPG